MLLSAPFPVGSSHITIRGKEEQVDEKSYQWFGATVQSSGKSGFILACAPRYVHFSVTRKRREPVGTCYLSRGSFTGFLEYTPCDALSRMRLTGDCNSQARQFCLRVHYTKGPRTEAADCFLAAMLTPETRHFETAS